MGLGAALWFRPWRMLRASELQHPWLASLVVLPWVWGVHQWLPQGLNFQMSGACLLVLMFGWPLAVVTSVVVAGWSAALAGASLEMAVELAAWNGVAPATLALLGGMALRRWLPHHLFVFILGRGFVVTALAMAGAGMVATIVHPLPQGGDLDTLLMGRWLIAWGEAFTTGMLTAIFVAFRPQWIVAYSDARYLHRGSDGAD